MEKRRAERRAKRFGVRFWERGEERGRVGHTLNISQEGMFIGTDRPPKSGARVRVEVTDSDVGFTVEGVVAHSHRVAPELRKIREPGMGVRFLTHEELVGPLMEKMGISNGSRDGAALSSYPVRFKSSWQFLQTLDRDIRHGGLFVPTPLPPGLNQVVPVALHVPGLEEPITAPARVVHRFDPAEQRPGAAVGRVAGMGVEFLDKEGVLNRLESLAQRLR